MRDDVILDVLCAQLNKLALEGRIVEGIRMGRPYLLTSLGMFNLASIDKIYLFGCETEWDQTLKPGFFEIDSRPYKPEPGEAEPPPKRKAGRPRKAAA